jgi:hypothetical protein
MFGTKRQWHGFVVRPLTIGQSAGATEEERAKALLVALILRDKLLPEFFLRRTKDIIKDQVVFTLRCAFSCLHFSVLNIVAEKDRSGRFLPTNGASNCSLQADPQCTTDGEPYSSR